MELLGWVRPQCVAKVQKIKKSSYSAGTLATAMLSPILGVFSRRGAASRTRVSGRTASGGAGTAGEVTQGILDIGSGETCEKGEWNDILERIVNSKWALWNGGFKWDFKGFWLHAGMFYTFNSYHICIHN